MIGKIFSLENLVLLAICLAAIGYSWWRDRHIKEKLGKIYAEFPIGKHKKWYKYWHWIMLGLLVLNGVVLYLINVLFAEPGESSGSNPMFIPFTLLTIEALARFRPTTVGETGLLLDTKVISWNDIKRIEWDRDIKQQLWSFTVYFTKNAAPLKVAIDREFQPEADELFKKFLKTEDQPEKVLA
ncbi:MAG: hypothetical protein V4642_11605 [Bacteroidota bacterium]